MLHRQYRRSDGVWNLVLRDRSQIQIGVIAVALVGCQKLAAGGLAKRAFNSCEIAAADILNLVAASKDGTRGRIPGKSYCRTEVVQVARIRLQVRVLRVRPNEDQLACIRPGTWR